MSFKASAMLPIASDVKVTWSGSLFHRLSYSCALQKLSDKKWCHFEGPSCGSYVTAYWNTVRLPRKRNKCYNSSDSINIQCFGPDGTCLCAILCCTLRSLLFSIIMITECMIIGASCWQVTHCTHAECWSIRHWLSWRFCHRRANSRIKVEKNPIARKTSA